MTQCEGDLSHAFKITVFDLVMCKSPDVPLLAHHRCKTSYCPDN